MGLMDVLEPFATGFLEGKIDIAQAKADAQKEKDKLLAEEASAIRLYTAQARIEADFNEKLKLADRKLIKTDLLNEGMSAQLLDIIPSRHLASTDTYNDFVTNQYGGDLNWYKQPFKKGDYEGTVGNYIILANQNFNKTEDTKSNLTGQGGVLEGQNNTANAMLEGDKKEEPTLTTELPSMFTQPKELVETLEGISEDTETQQTVSDVDVPAFSGLGASADFFTGYDLSTEEGKETRNQNIIKNIAQLGGFGDEAFTVVEGAYVPRMAIEDIENKRYNSINELAIDWADAFYKQNGYSATGNDAVNAALKMNDEIKYLAEKHRDGKLDVDVYTELAQAGNLNVITVSQALEIQRYEDILKLESYDLGYMPRLYYREISGFNPTPRKPDGYDTFQDDLDDALLLSSIDENYDADGEIIPEISIEFDGEKEKKTTTVKGKEIPIGVDVGPDLETLQKQKEEILKNLENETNNVQKKKYSSQLKSIEREIKKLQEN